MIMLSVSFVLEWRLLQRESMQADILETEGEGIGTSLSHEEIREAYKKISILGFVLFFVSSLVASPEGENEFVFGGVAAVFR